MQLRPQVRREGLRRILCGSTEGRGHTHTCGACKIESTALRSAICRIARQGDERQLAPSYTCRDDETNTSAASGDGTQDMLQLICRARAPSTVESAVDGWGAIILAVWASSMPCRTGVPSAECGSGGDGAHSA